MSIKRSFKPFLANSGNVKSSLSGTVRANNVARKDLAFWLPRTIPLLTDGVAGAKNLQQLLTVPKAHIGHILSVLVTIYRQNRDPDGKRFSNASLLVKVNSWQRVIREELQKEYNRLVLVNPKTPVRTFNIYDDPELKVLYDALDKEMKLSASLGLTSGIMKRKRTETPQHIQQILKLWDLQQPKDVEHVFALTVMMQLGPRGGKELRNMTCSQFEPKFSEGVGHYYDFTPMKQGSFKNYNGGVSDFKKVRKDVQIFDNSKVLDCYNPYRVIQGYFSLLPKGWMDKDKNNPLFLAPKAVIKHGVGVQKPARGRNITAKFLERAMKRIGVEGKFTNTQIRSAVITSALETGMKDNEIRAITGHRSETALNSYKAPSLRWKKASREKMLSSVVHGQRNWVSCVQPQYEALPSTGESFDLQPVVRSTGICVKRKSVQAGGIVTRHEKLAVTVRNQQLFKMLVDQQNAFLEGDEKTEVLTVQGEYSQE